MQLKTKITEEDISQLGLKSGLEIHQQLEGRKLFCNCPTHLRDDSPDFIIKRFIRASAGESGTVDVAAAQEIKKQKHYFYQGYTDTTCLVELDEEPPQPVSSQAVVAGMQTAKLMHMQVLDQLRFMRKIVANGSNTTGFQRTALLALTGHIETSFGNVGIDMISLEEDSCKDIEKDAVSTTYNLSRLGIPLLEIATAPDLKTPEHIAEAASHIGMILRSVPAVKRGLGTIRQDVNISIRHGVRVEIKGAQDLKMIPTLARYEMLRQYNLLQLFSELVERKASVGTPQEISALHSSESKVIRSALEKKDGVVVAVPLSGFQGLLGKEIQPGRRLGSEYSDYAKVMGVKGLFHSDELPKYGITPEETDAIYAELTVQKESCAFLLIAAEKKLAWRAIEAACERAEDFSLRQEVRVAKQDGTTQYMRPMPGASRMYPETDVPAQFLDDSQVEVPELLTVRTAKLAEKYNLAEDIVKRLLRDAIDLEQVATDFPSLKISFIVDSLYSLPAQVQKKYEASLSQDAVFMLLKKLDAGDLTKDAFEEVAVLVAQGKPVDFEKFKPVALDSIVDDVRAIVKSLEGAPKGAIIGKVMATYKGKVPGQDLVRLVDSFLKN